MIPWVEVDRALVPGTNDPIILMQHGTDFEIRVGTSLLMASRAHGSEELLAELACSRLASRPGVRVLIGGLGMGFTVAAALRELGPGARVVVADLSPAVVTWNRGPLADLADRPLEDRRVSVVERDVGEPIRERPAAWDAILLDVDNGPTALTHARNAGLYSTSGLVAARTALRPGGILGIWSSSPDREFTRRLARVGFEVEEEVVRARRKQGARHTLWLATRTA